MTGVQLLGRLYRQAPRRFGVANDPELAVQLLKRYAQSMKSVGVHVTFEPYGNEIGSFNSEDPEYIAKMTELEVATLNENGLATCTKHWIGRAETAPSRMHAV